MNHLAHLFLSEPTDGGYLGALMGDYVKGRLDGRFPKALRRGLLLHRKIDRFAETNRHFLRSKRRFHPALRHGRGILVDVAYDHLLAYHWSDFLPVPLETFAASIYRLLERYHELLPPTLQQAAPRMVAADWLVACRKKETIARILQRLEKRLEQRIPLSIGLNQIEGCHRQLASDCRLFLNDAKAFVSRQINLLD